MTELKWTRKTTAKVAAELRRTGIRVSPNTVARLLKHLDYRLRSNEKKIARCSPADRDDQFRKIAALRKTFEADGLPIISIDTKKKEQVGLFKNAGNRFKVTDVLFGPFDLGIDVDEGRVHAASVTDSAARVNR